MVQNAVHYSLHLIVPLGIAIYFYKSQWKHAYFILLATMLIDLDHLLATPIFDPNRCSINFHPLHSYPAMVVYAFMLGMPKYWRLIGVGCLFHLFTDALDCTLNSGTWEWM